MASTKCISMSSVLDGVPTTPDISKSRRLSTPTSFTSSSSSVSGAGVTASTSVPDLCSQAMMYNEKTVRGDLRRLVDRTWAPATSSDEAAALLTAIGDVCEAHEDARMMFGEHAIVCIARLLRSRQGECGLDVSAVRALRLLVSGNQFSSQVARHAELVLLNHGALLLKGIMEQHDGSEDAALWCSDLAFVLARDAKGKASLGRVGMVKCIASAATTYASNAKVQKSAWAALANMCSGNRKNSDAVWECAGVIGSVTSAMTAHADNTSVIVECLRLLAVLYHAPIASVAASTAPVLINALVSTVPAIACITDCARYTCWLLSGMCQVKDVRSQVPFSALIPVITQWLSNVTVSSKEWLMWCLATLEAGAASCDAATIAVAVTAVCHASCRCASAVDTTVACLNTLSVLARVNVEFREVVATASARTILSLMDKHEKCADVQKMACAALCELAFASPRAAGHIVSLGALRRIIAGMYDCNTSAAVQLQGCKAIRELCTQCEDACGLVASGAGLAVVFDALIDHGCNGDVVRRCCEVISVVGRRDKAAQSELARLNGARVINGVLDSDVAATDSFVASEALRALMPMIDATPVSMTDDGLLENAVKLARCHHKSNAVQRSLCALLTSLSFVSEMARCSIVSSGAVRYIVSLLSSRCDNPKMTADVLRCLSGVGFKCRPAQAILAEPDVLAALTRVTVEHMAAESVAKWCVGCFTAAARVGDGKSLSALRGCGVREVMFRVMALHPTASELRAKAASVAKQLA